MRRDFKGDIYWDELAETCSDISRAAGFQGAARFQGNTVYIYFNLGRASGYMKAITHSTIVLHQRKIYNTESISGQQHVHVHVGL